MAENNTKDENKEHKDLLTRLEEGPCEMRRMSQRKFRDFTGGLTYNLKFIVILDDSKKEILLFKEIDFRDDDTTYVNAIAIPFYKRLKKEGVIKRVQYELPHPEGKTRPVGGCYITTACIRAANLEDNCEVLQTLRAFRDNFIRALPRGAELVQKYYKTAPKIVRKIESRPGSIDVFKRLFDDEIIPAFKMIINGDYNPALNRYVRMVNRLKREF